MKESRRIFNVTFVVSLVFHSLILLPLPDFQKQVSQKTPPELNLKYMVLKPETPGKSEIPKKNLKPLIEEILRTETKEPMPVAKTREEIAQYPKETSKVALEMREPKKEPQILSKEILDKNDKEKEKNFINYYKLINEQLRQSIIYPQYFSDGEISVSFVLTSDGNLQSVEVIPEVSTNDMTLRETAIQIVRNASPFPPFPDSLQKKQLTFNVVIYFREKS